MSRKKTCKKKRCVTKAEAKTAISEMAHEFRFTYKAVYRCGQCRAWHVTSTSPQKGRRKQW